MKVLLTGINSKYIHTALGVRCVAEYAKMQGFAVDILEESINTPILRVLDKLVAAKADVYGFSVHIWSKKYVTELIGLLLQVFPLAKIVLGGPEAGQVTLNNDRITVIQGEGEIAFCEYLQGKAVSGKTVDLAELPFVYPDLEQVIAEHKIVYYEASRGCPFRCSYCLSSVEHNVRQKPLPKVLAELDRFVAANVPLVKFVDRTYNLDEKFYLPVFQHLAAAQCDTTFHFEIKADLLSDKVLDFLATVPKGRFQFEVGIQSTNPDTLRAINRSNDWDKIAGNCRKILQNGNIHLHTDLIAGLPYEDLASWRKSFNEVFLLGAPMLQLGFLKVLPNTEIEQKAEQYGLVYMPEPPYEILATKWLGYGDLEFLRKFDKIFDVLHNGGHFPHYLAALLQDFDEPYELFAYIVGQWTVGEGETYNARSVATALHNIFGKRYENLLQKDIFNNIHHWRPDWLDWSEYTHKKLKMTAK
ncbi:MAG: DUF4080 domain-containing protein [Phascolarctobacterium sp.]|nr:DUF4080 domain-containing protein [Candidatus Phascolarctobacterium caballi]